MAGGLDDAGTDDSYTDGDVYVRPSVINEAIAMDLSCARDHKWRLVSMAIERQECNCVNQARIGLRLLTGWVRGRMSCTPPMIPRVGEVLV